MHAEALLGKSIARALSFSSGAQGNWEPIKHTKEILWYKQPPFLPSPRPRRVRTGYVNSIFLFSQLTECRLSKSKLKKKKSTQANKQKSALNQHKVGGVDWGYQLLGFKDYLPD